ncbi:hypothetical protein PPYR_01191 [Photinus pyralis]|uniref:Tyr recombinase domain-containing protein n=1 Tax=Photinus pyralis TaxID=7054 RepID=A0A5N4B3M5_PHOPY|nr:hypothetical protein PPYR_01191 [Photinus pyralis]
MYISRNRGVPNHKRCDEVVMLKQRLNLGIEGSHYILYVPKKSKILSREGVLRFLREASDDQYLLDKVVLVMGVFGALRRCKLVNLTVDDIDDRGAVVVVNISDTKTGGPKSFTIIGESELNALLLYRKYAALRPKGKKERRFFLSYRNCRCTAQPVGKNTFGCIPSKVAKYLGYADAKDYTSHCLRRTSATLLVNAGADMLTLKRHGKWESDTVVSGYIEDSMASKNKISRLIAGAAVSNSGPSVSSSTRMERMVGILMCVQNINVELRH